MKVRRKQIIITIRMVERAFDILDLNMLSSSDKMYLGLIKIIYIIDES
jgi:hypothetical protein